MSSSHTFPKCLSSVSTTQCMNSCTASSFSCSSTPTMKNKEAYLRYMTFIPRCSTIEHCLSLLVRHLRTISPSICLRSAFGTISL